MATGTYRTTLQQRGLWPFLWTQFLGAFNDNVFKIIVSFYVMRRLGDVNGVTLAAATFILPFLLFSGYAGHFADTRSKGRVLVWTKALEIVAMLLAIPALVSGRIDLMLVVLFLMSTQATFFSPAKYSIIPEIVPAGDLSRANGLLEMSTFLAIVLGTSIGGAMFQFWHNRPWYLAVILLGIAVGGTLTSLRIPRRPPAKPGQRFVVNPWGEIGRGFSRMYSDRTLWTTAMGVAYFWFLGALLQQLLLPFGQEALVVGEAASTRLYTWLAIGIGAGSLAAGRLSGDKIELGLVPIGSFGMGIFSLGLVAAVPSYATACAMLVALGFAGGLFAVPLNALLQQRPDEAEKGRVLATNNFLQTIGILLSSAALWLLGNYFAFTMTRIMLIAGVFTLIATLYILTRVPGFFLRFTLWALTHTIYRIKIVGRPNIPERGPALLVCNHVSFIDGALVGACIQRFVRFLVWGPYYHRRGINWMMTRLHAIPISASREDLVRAIEQVRTDLSEGHVVCIFAEGSVSRTGNLLPFRRGFERMVEGLDVPIIPVYLDRVWGSVFSFKGEKFFWKRPERLPYPVTIAFGDPMPSTSGAVAVRQAVMELGTEAIGHRRPDRDLLHAGFMQGAKRHWRRLAMADSTGQRLSYGRSLVGSLLLARQIERRGGTGEMVGILLPASVGGALANIAMLAAGRIPVNLNFTAGPDAMETAIQECNIRTILTSRRFLEKAGIEATASMVCVEDLMSAMTGIEKLSVLLQARLWPAWLLVRRYGGRGRTADSLATIIFSSGSTGVPKGVMISHRNILANVDSIAQVFPMGPDDCFLGVLPFFHSFGLTGTLWFPLLQGCGLVYHANPMDAKTVGELAETYRASMLISTPTFCQAYARRCTPEQFAHLRYAIVGAEKLREPLASAFQERFGVALLEGYGCTEMSPVVAVNRPDAVFGRERQVGTKAGSVGHPIPGVAAKIVDQDTGEGPIYGRAGLLLVKGPNMMQGYLGQPQRTAEVFRGGWYVTGDIATIDEDGFIFITDRLSRFSKIGGEMVPHLKIEDTINELIGEASSAVTAIPDAARGERLVAFYMRPDIPPDELWEQLAATDLPRLWLPRRDSLIQVEAIPTLGTGKVDLRKLRELASAKLERQLPAVP
jgi:acyl-[acyl-carrier-protein]-phospholipid O-acyltransferase/long-chain-fatty-acid--[acyl-carrier-protein] ligase